MNWLNTKRTQLLFLTAICALAATLLLGMASNASQAQEVEEQPSFFDQLVDHARTQAEIPRLSLTFDHQQLEDMKYSKSYFPATLTFGDDNWDTKLRIRGRYRRRVCDFPPLRVKFKKSKLRAAGLEDYNKFKLVTHCSDDFDNHDNLLREQLSYELYRLITGQGFRTQLIEVTYHDTETGESFQRMGILIEDPEEMADAHAGKECKNCSYLPTSAFVKGNPETVSLFNYMIGNADWSATNQRNVEILQQEADEQHLLVPYDFDFAGLVDVEYAVPNPDYKQLSVKDRVWVWEYEEAPAQLTEVIAHYQSKEADIMKHVDTFPGLHKRSRRRISKYLANFFEELNDGSFLASI